MNKENDLQWLNRKEYPFKSHFFTTPVGKMHYVDEGAGDPILFVHGNPSWSFEFRNLIKVLSNTFRCIAPDHIGFGLSDKPQNWSYLPKEHAENLELFIESLDVHNCTIVVGDWGGPIGLSYGIKHPEKIKNFVITNTWLWSAKHELYYQAYSKFVGGPIGKCLIKSRNFFARDIVKGVFGDKKKLTKEIHKHYIMPMADPNERKGNWVFPKHVIESSEWLESLWNKRNALKGKDITIAWGMKDPAFRKKELNRWIEAFPDARIIRFPDAGHFVAEEKPDEIFDAITNINKKQERNDTDAGS